METKAKIVLSHPTGNAFVRSAALSFQAESILEQFFTTIAIFPNSFPDKLASLKIFSEFKRRSFCSDLRPITHATPLMEIGRLAALKFGWQSLTKQEKGFFSIDSVYSNLDNRVALKLKALYKKGVRGIYAYEDGALKSFTEGKKYGMSCFYDLPIGYWRTHRQLLEIEKQKWPEWSPTLVGLTDSISKLERKEEELKKADKIFVASTFTANTLKSFNGTLAPIQIVPYGFPPVCADRTYRSINNAPLKLLFVGGLSQRKGIADVFAAVKKFGHHVELTVVGRKPVQDCTVLNIELKKHKWFPSLPHNEILKLMREHDVLIFPSLFEGFGLVITEAMSQGTPVITTERTAGPDIITNNENGWIVKAGSQESLETAIEQLIRQQSMLKEAGIAALKAAQKRPWSAYGEELIACINRHFQDTI